RGRRHRRGSARGTRSRREPRVVPLRWKERGAGPQHGGHRGGRCAGGPRQSALVAKIVAAMAPVPVEVGGGLRSVKDVETALETGARWAVVGTRAALDRAFLDDVCRRHPGRILVAGDAKGERVAVKGWTEVVDDTVVEVGLRARGAGAAALLYTDVSRDGTEAGPNVEYTATVARDVAMPVLASGGVGRVEDLARLAAIPG